MDSGKAKTESRHSRHRILKFYLFSICIVCIGFILVTEYEINNKTYLSQIEGTYIDPSSVSSQLYNYEMSTLPPDIQRSWEINGRTMLNMFMVSAVGKNISSHNGYQALIKLNGWLALKHFHSVMKCCIKMDSGAIIEYHRPLSYPKKPLTLRAVQVSCPIKSPLKDVRGVTLQYAGTKCPQNNMAYIKPSASIKPDGNESFAICLKIVYGHVNIPLMVEWLEYHRLIGVNKIFMFTYNLSREVNDVLKQYIKEGFLEKQAYNFPRNKLYPIGNKNKRYWEDEQVVVHDCHQRLSQYKYISIIDLDEFIVPRKHDNITDMMRYLMKKYPLAAGFWLKPYLFVIKKSVPPLKNNSNLGSYFNRTIQLSGWKSRNKNIILPSRTTPQKIHTHRFSPIFNFKVNVPDPSSVTFNHYRKCYPDLRKECKNLTHDTFVLKFLNRLDKRTQTVNKSKR